MSEEKNIPEEKPESINSEPSETSVNPLTQGKVEPNISPAPSPLPEEEKNKNETTEPSIPSDPVFSRAGLNPPPQTSKMEVHHPHHVTHKKKWGEYLLEFFMLFLAVFCGFMAENQREHMIEHRREKQYMQNLLQDLKRDSSALVQEIRLRNRRQMVADSLIMELDSADKIINTANIYLHAYYLTPLRIFGYSNVTIEQLKNSGSMRLIRKENVADSIASYDIAVQQYKIREEGEREILPEYRKAICFLLDARAMIALEGPSNPNIYERPGKNVPLLTKEPATINLVKGLAAQIYTRNGILMFSLKGLLNKNDALVDLLKKEYHLENE